MYTEINKEANMKIIDKRGLTGIIVVCLKIVFIAGVIVTIALPWIFKNLFGVSDLTAKWPIVMMSTLYISSPLMLVIICQAIKVINSISDKKPFTYENAKSFKICSIFAFCVSVVFTGKFIFEPTVLTMVFISVFVLGGLFCIVLSELFKLATQIKEENELMI